MNNLLLLVLAILCIQATSFDYNITQSKQYWVHAGISHCSKSQVQSWTCKDCHRIPNIQNVTYIENAPLQIVGYVAYDKGKNRIIISWRGTIDARNWYQDFNFEKVPYLKCKGCQIHTGFYGSFKSVEERTKATVQRLVQAFPTATIHSVGHSLGGALATICAIQFESIFKQKIVEVHNFGSPRVGNKALAEYIGHRIPNNFRVVHNRDIVPHLPPLQFIYWHQPYEIFFDQKMIEYKVCNDSGQDKTCSDKFFPDYTFQDHDSYFTHGSC